MHMEGAVRSGEAAAGAILDFHPEQRRHAMPLIRCELFDYRVTPEVSAALIEKLTDALCDVVHPDLRSHTWVIVEGHDPTNWGVGGKPWPVGEMPPGP
jgi:phenylpyruvate tautomerase PptA (4-oxalocrotonate tautomerase family)